MSVSLHLENENRNLVNFLKDIMDELNQKLCIEGYQRSDLKRFVVTIHKRIGVLIDYAGNIDERLTNVTEKLNTFQRFCDETAIKMKNIKKSEENISKHKSKITELQQNIANQIELQTAEIKNRKEFYTSKTNNMDVLCHQIAEYKSKLPEQKENEEKLAAEIKELTTKIQIARLNTENELQKLQILKDTEQKICQDFEEKMASIPTIESVQNE